MQMCKCSNLSVLSLNVFLLCFTSASDTIVEPQRAPLIPGMGAVTAAAKNAGAYGCTISGAGPTAVAITNSEEQGKLIGAAMVDAFASHGGLRATAYVSKLDNEGARIVEKH
jgi:homoserine kinase